MVAGAIMAAGVTFAVLSARPEVSASSDPFAFPCDAVPEMSQVGGTVLYLRKSCILRPDTYFC